MQVSESKAIARRSGYRVSFSRVLLVTLGLTVTGALVGAAAAVFIVASWSVILDGPGVLWGSIRQSRFVAMFGAAIGSVLAPLAAWTFLRRVPLGRAILETAIGTVVGSAAGLILSSSNPLAGLYGAVAGMLLATVRLWWGSRRV